VQPVREVNLLRLLHLNEMRATIVEARVMAGYYGIMSGGLAQLIRPRYPARNYRIRVDQAVAARLNLRGRLQFGKVSGVRSGRKRRLPFCFSNPGAVGKQSDAAHAHGNQGENCGDTKN